MNVGFTGTRNGWTRAQREAFSRVSFIPEMVEFHHGACIGADEQAAEFVVNTYDFVMVVAHPGKPSNGDANEFLSQPALELSHTLMPAKTHFARNRDIVDACDLLIACPWQKDRPAPKTGGGTWYTIEYAEKEGKEVRIIWPDGAVTNLPGTEVVSEGT